MNQKQIPPYFRVLSIDDSDIDRLLLREMIGAGIKYVPEVRLEHETSSVASAIQWLTACPMDALPHIITCDVEMPMQGGWMFVRLLRSYHQFDHIPVIMVSSRVNDDGFEAIAREHAVAGWIAKELKREELERVFFQVIRQHYLPRPNVLIVTDVPGDGTSLRNFLENRGYASCVLGAVRTAQQAMTILSPATQGIGCIIVGVATLMREQTKDNPYVQQLIDYSKGAEIPLICIGAKGFKYSTHSEWARQANLPCYVSRTWGPLKAHVDRVMGKGQDAPA